MVTQQKHALQLQLAVQHWHTVSVEWSQYTTATCDYYDGRTKAVCTHAQHKHTLDWLPICSCVLQCWCCLSDRNNSHCFSLQSLTWQNSWKKDWYCLTTAATVAVSVRRVWHDRIQDTQLPGVCMCACTRACTHACMCDEMCISMYLYKHSRLFQDGAP